jgi:hypothetical protein
MSTLSQLEILAGAERKIRLPEETVTVVEMPWGKTIAFIEKLSERLADIMRVKAADGGGASLGLNLTDPIKLVTSSRLLTEELVLGATGKDVAWLEAQSPRAVLAILDAAIEINLSDELKKLGKAVGLRVASGLGLAGASSAQTSST